ncbi:MAG: hypothetical protein ACYCOU_21830 [Sulfobacillus sp.]
MTEKPIIFSAPMVRAILEGRKSQTRRIVKPAPYLQEISGTYGGRMLCFPDRARKGHGLIWPNAREAIIAQCPHGTIGDRLWVRETWRPDPPCHSSWASTEFYGCRDAALSLIPKEYRNPTHCLFSASCAYRDTISWRSPIYMPRWASRLLLEITDVRVQRVQEISEEDAIAEGARRFKDLPRTRAYQSCEWSMETPSNRDQCLGCAKYAFGNYWNSLHGEVSWDANPYVFAISFRRIP